MGISRGDCVAILGNNHMEWPIVTGAAQAIGVIMVFLQVGHAYKTLGEMIQKTSCKALFITRSPEIYSDMCNMIPELSNSIPGDLKSAKFPSLKYVVATGANNSRGTINLDNLYTTGFEENVSEAAYKVVTEDISFMMMTSGTTGTPKLVKCSHLRALNTSHALIRNVKEHEVATLVCCGNLAYADSVVQSLACPLLIGSTCVYPFPGGSEFQVEKLYQAIENERVTHMMLLINWLVEFAYSPLANQYDLSSLKAGFGTGSPIPQAILAHIIKNLNIDMLISYGSTEVFDVSCVLIEEGLKSCTTVGKPLQNVEVKVVNDEGNVVKFGEDGNILVRNKIFFEGYHADIDKTKEVMSSDGWLKMGDTGRLDESGNLIIIGRTKDVIIRSALKIYPFYLETVLLSHPAIRNIQVVGIPDYRYGEDVCACVILNTGWSLTTDDIKNHCENKCFKKSLPSYCLEFESFPLGVTGKIDRMKLRKMAIDRISVPAVPHVEA